MDRENSKASHVRKETVDIDILVIYPGLSDKEQECEENLIRGKIHIQRHLNEHFEYSWS